MLNSLNLAATVVSYKRRTYTVLSAMTLVMLSPLVQAENNNPTNDNLTNPTVSPTSYCYNDNATPDARGKYPEPYIIDCMLTQLSFYQHKNLNSRQQYFAYKAQAWLDYASYENSIKRQSAAGNQALESGAAILKALQKDNADQLSLITNIPSTSALMRPDLWAIISALKESALKDDTKNNKSIIIAPRELAFSEVALVWAAADQCQYGSNQSGIRFQMAERWLEQARETYVNTHDSKTNVALENLMVSYYQQYAPLDPHNDVCLGQSLPLSTQPVDSNHHLSY